MKKNGQNEEKSSKWKKIVKMETIECHEKARMRKKIGQKNITKENRQNEVRSLDGFLLRNALCLKSTEKSLIYTMDQNVMRKPG